MDITSYSREKITKGLENAKSRTSSPNDLIRILFSPTVIDDENFDRVCEIYGSIDPQNYETVIIIESYDKVLDKKLPMPSNQYFETPLGKVPVNDYMRNEFCDEDDDFFIHDEGFSKDMSLFQQLMVLQCLRNDFSVVSIQIADMGQAIVKELAYVLQEVLAPRRALLVFCCDLENKYKKEFRFLKEMIEEGNDSGLLNYLNGAESHVEGTTTFISGLLVANAWQLDLNFLNGQYAEYTGSLLTGYADRQQIIF